MKKRTHLSRLLCAVAAIATLLALNATALADGNGYDLTYAGPGEFGAYVDGAAHIPVLLRIRDGAGKESTAYCVDSATYVVDGSAYRRDNLEDAAYFSPEVSGRIRAVVLGSYPAVKLQDLSQRANLPTLTAAEAITATQAVIWKLEGDVTSPLPEGNIASLASYLTNLPAKAAGKAVVGKIFLDSSTDFSGGTCTAVYTYSSDAQNADSTKVSLNHGFTTDPAAVYGATVEPSANPDGSVTVKVSGLPADAVFSFFVTGTQTLEEGAYYYSPLGGRTATQSLVGAYSGTTKLYESVPFSCEAPEDYRLRVQKYDSSTQQGVEGAVFQLSDNESFNNPVLYEKTTDGDGYVTFTGLTAGTWFLREKTAPVGYIPDVKVYEIPVDQEPQDVIRFKNTHYGEIRIVKTDDAGGPVKGAVFSIYAGDKAEGEPLHKGLTTDDTGLILQGSIAPGVYTVVETDAPEGYHLAKENKVVITVEPHGTVAVAMTNPKILRGKIGVVKANYVTGELLSGAEVGVYRDQDCTDCVATFVTDKDDCQYCEDLLPGTYYVKELAAPEGYIINPANQVVTVELEEGEIETVTFRNRPRIDTAGNYGLLLLIGLGAVAVSGGLLLVFRKKLLTKTDR